MTRMSSPPTGGSVTVTAATDNGNKDVASNYKEFTLDTSVDDFFTHHAPAAAR